jgi:hypothetical protein
MLGDAPMSDWLGQYILNAAGEPERCEDVEKWGHWLETGERLLDHTGNADIRVSTVFLGIDHRHFGDGPPILFETMVFGGAHDQSQERYCTRAEALEGHKRWVATVFPGLAALTTGANKESKMPDPDEAVTEIKDPPPADPTPAEPTTAEDEADDDDAGTGEDNSD